MLPEGESRLGRVGVSLIAQILILGFFVALPVFFPERLKAVLNQQVIPLAMPVTEIATPPPPKPIVKAKVEPPKPAPVEIKLNPKQPHIFVQQKVLQPKIEKVEVKAPELATAPVIQSQIVDQSNQPKRPREEVKMAMDSGSAATPTIKADPKECADGWLWRSERIAGQGRPEQDDERESRGIAGASGRAGVWQRNRWRQGRAWRGGELGIWKRDRGAGCRRTEAGGRDERICEPDGGGQHAEAEGC